MTSWRTLARAVAAAGVAVSFVLLPAGPAAHAAPDIDAIEAALDKQWEKIEPLIEQYNRVHSQLQANQKKAADLQHKVRPLSLQVDLATTRVGEIAAQQYKYGPISSLNAVLETGSPTALGDQLALLDRVARRQREQIAVASAARDKYRAEKQKLDRLVATQKKQETELAARRKAIQADIDRLEQQRREAYNATAAATASSSSGSLRIGACPPAAVSGAAGTAVKTACAQIGDPYVFGDAGPDSFDCSGLTQYAWGKAGVSLTHYTGSQWTEGTAVSRANARPGDLVFFYSDHHHVGLYVGNGLMVHASRSGVPVKMAKIDSSGPIAGFRRVG